MSIINNCIIQRHTQKINLFTSSPSPQPPQKKKRDGRYSGLERVFALCPFAFFIYFKSSVCNIYFLYYFLFDLFFKNIIFFTKICIVDLYLFYLVRVNLEQKENKCQKTFLSGDVLLKYF